jgi:hypothetical protein
MSVPYLLDQKDQHCSQSNKVKRLGQCTLGVALERHISLMHDICYVGTCRVLYVECTLNR